MERSAWTTKSRPINDFEEPLIASLLPPAESLRNINTLLGAAEAGSVFLTLLGRPFAG
jgi:hypothetical protein